MSEQEQHDHLEFNDGLGDLLREKRPRSKGINRSVWIAAGAVVAVVVGFGIAFKWGTKMLFRAKVATVQVVNSDGDVAKVDAENRRLIHEMEALLAQASSNVANESAVESAPVPKVAVPVSKPARRPVKKVVPKIVHTAAISQPAKPVSVPKPRPVVSKAVVVPVAKRGPIGGLIKVSAGTFNTHGEALEIALRLKKLGYPVYVKEHGSSWILQVGAFRNATVADGIVADLQRKGFNASIVTP
jgi:cell division septation protein DedD